MPDSSASLYARSSSGRHSALGNSHGRMKPAERDKQMAAFQSGMFRVLVATTVVEVGVDVTRCQIGQHRILAARGNIVIDISVLAKQLGDEPATIADRMLDRIPG